jgi:hypothetical protein
MYWFDIPDELLPPVYAAIKDMYAYARTLDTQLRDSIVDMGDVKSNFFIQACDEETLAYWESLLGIELYGGESLEDRRQMVLLYLNNRFPTSEAYIRHVMGELFGEDGYSLNINPNNPYKLDIQMFDTTYDAVKRFMRWFIRMCPAHLLFHANDTERATETLYISSVAPGQYLSHASDTMTSTTSILYLGNTGTFLQTLNW